MFEKKQKISPSLLDTGGYRVVDWYVVYRERPAFRWWTKLMPHGFRHVELWRRAPYGPALSDAQWLVLYPCFEFLEADIVNDPTPPWVRDPTCTVQKVTATRRLTTVRDWFHMGPMTCVEYVKAALGIRAFFIRTPHQLYKYIQARDNYIRN